LKMNNRTNIAQHSAIVFIAVLFIMFNGCVNPFAPGLADNDESGSRILTEQQTPEEVLINFSYAYNFKDSLVYADLLDSSFQFIFINYSTEQPTSDNWGRDQDIRSTIRMFRHFQKLDLVWGETTSTLYLDDDSTQAELKKTFQLTLDGGNEIPTLSGLALFTFVRKRSGIWKIKRWDDLSKI